MGCHSMGNHSQRISELCDQLSYTFLRFPAIDRSPLRLCNQLCFMTDAEIQTGGQARHELDERSNTSDHK